MEVRKKGSQNSRLPMLVLATVFLSFKHYYGLLTDNDYNDVDVDDVTSPLTVLHSVKA